MTTQTPPAVPDTPGTDALDRALAHLVADGRLSDDLSHLVHDEYVKEQTQRPLPVPSDRARRAVWTGRLVEIGAYLGAALAAAGGAMVVAEQWEALGRVGQMFLFAALTAVLGVSGIVVARISQAGPHGHDQGSVARRLASTLLTLAAASAAGLVVVALVTPDREMSDQRGGLTFLLVTVVAGSVLLVARLVVPSALAEVGLFGALAFAPMGVLLLAGWSGSRYAPVLAYVAFGVGYAALAELTRMLTVPTLGVVLGLAVALLFGAGPDPVNQVVLGLLAAGCFAAYFVRPHWPFVTAAVLAAIFLTFSLVGGRFGGALAMLVAGTLLLLGAATVLAVQRRRARELG